MLPSNVVCKLIGVVLSEEVAKRKWTYQVRLLPSLLPVILLELVSLAEDRVDVEAAIDWTEVHLEV